MVFNFSIRPHRSRSGSDFFSVFYSTLTLKMLRGVYISQSQSVSWLLLIHSIVNLGVACCYHGLDARLPSVPFFFSFLFYSFLPLSVSLSLCKSHPHASPPLSLCLSLSLYIYIYIYIYVTALNDKSIQKQFFDKIIDKKKKNFRWH